MVDFAANHVTYGLIIDFFYRILCESYIIFKYSQNFYRNIFIFFDKLTTLDGMFY